MARDDDGHPPPPPKDKPGLLGPTSDPLGRAAQEAEATLRQEAERALASGNLQEALGLAIRLERMSPEEPKWPRLSAGILQRMGRNLDEIDALERACQRHAERGETLSAAALCKRILSLDPDHAPTRERLKSLRAAHARATQETIPPPPSPPQVGPTPPSTPRKAGLRGIPLKDVVKGSRPDRGSRQGVHAIPLQVQTNPALELNKVRKGFPPPAVDQETVDLGFDDSFEEEAVALVAEELKAATRTERALTDTPLFRDLPEAAFHALIDRARLVSFKRNEMIFRQGDRGETLFVIGEGEVGVIDEGPPRRGIHRLGPGDFFGEMALVGGVARNASCAALSNVELIALDVGVMQDALREYPQVLTAMLRFFRDRSIEWVMRTSPLFQNLSEEDRAVVRPYFRFLEVEPGSSIITEGEVPKGVLIMMGGIAEAITHRDGRDERVSLLSPGTVAGEQSIVRNTASVVTIRAVDKVLAVEFPAKALLQILEQRPNLKAFLRPRPRSASISSHRPQVHSESFEHSSESTDSG